METKTKSPIQEKRDILKEHSKTVAPLVKEGMYNTINEAIVKEIYQNERNQEFKTYEQWKAEGKQVRKGEKAFLVWGKPKGSHEGEEQTAEDEKEKFFPVCFLFSNSQVN